MLSFLKERKIDWCGIQGEEPSSEQFRSLLEQNSILL